jgi:hypothetical protein
MALQQGNGYRLVLARISHANLFAKLLDRANPGAGRAHDVGLQDRPARAQGIVRGDAADKSWYVDAGGTGLDAGRVMAVMATAGLYRRLAFIQWRMEIGKRRLIAGLFKPSRRNVTRLCHFSSAPSILCRKVKINLTIWSSLLK